MARPKTSVTARRTSASKPKSASELLDELLSLVEPATNEVHHDAAVLEVGDPTQLLELAADTALRSFLICRLAPNIALVDPGRAHDLVDALRRRGHTPKILKP